MTELFKNLFSSPKETPDTMSFIDFGPIMAEFSMTGLFEGYDFQYLFKRFQKLVSMKSVNGTDLEDLKTMSAQFRAIAIQCEAFQKELFKFEKVILEKLITP